MNESSQKTFFLSDLVEFVSERTSPDSLTLSNYISTENMVADRGGVTPASKIPSSGSVTKFSESDTLFSNIRTYFRKVWLASFDGGASPDVLVFRTKNPKRLLPVYLYYLLSNRDFTDYSDLTAKGAKMPRGDKAALMQYTVSLPDFQKQIEISKILKDLDEKISINRCTNETLEAMGQAVFKSWFVDFEPVKAKVAVLEAGGSEEEARLAAMQAISGKTAEELAALKTSSPEAYQSLATTADAFPSAFVESALGVIPEGWEVKGLDEIAEYLNGLALQKFRPKDETKYLPVLKIAHLKKGSTDGVEKASLDIKPEYIVDNGDIIFSWSGSLVVDVWCGGKAALNQHLFKVTSKDYPKWLFYYFTKYHLVEFQRIAAAKAVTMGHIKREHLSQAICAVPKLDSEIMRLAHNYLQSNLQSQIERKLENTTLAELRDALLPRLLSGELMVKVEE